MITHLYKSGKKFYAGCLSCPQPSPFIRAWDRHQETQKCATDDLYARLETKEGEKELYRLARQRDRAGKDVQHVRVINDENGNVMVNSEAVLKRWKEYFEKLMNEENNREPRTEEPEVVKEEVNCVSREEVKNALRRMKKGKAVGPDELPVEV